MCRHWHNVDHGLTGTNRARPGLREALAACRAGDTLVVTKLDRLARSLPDAHRGSDGEQVAALWHRLMVDGPGYSRYAAHGSDLGRGVTGVVGTGAP